MTATAAFRADHVRTSRLRLLVVGDGVYATYPLPEQGDLVIGRSNKADICIDDPAISRRHAVLHVHTPPVPANPRDSASFEPELHIEDLGSSNGVRVREKKLGPRQTVDVGVGDTIELGSTALIVQRSPAASRLRRLWSHGAFEARLEDECARAERSGLPFSVIRVHVEGTLPPVAVQETLGTELRSIDVIATYGPNEYEALLIDAAPDKADEMASRVTSGLTRLGASALVGVATYPKDGRTPEELIAKACAAVRDIEEAAGPPVVVPDGTMQKLYKLVKRIAASPISVLLLGETGVGKEVMAETIHRDSPRAGKPLLRLNCAALSEQLLESELFGHERGAFTGAVVAKPGLLETAHGGTVFLDELGEMPLSTQAKLLRVLEDRQVQRVGSLKPKPIDVRFVAATNRDLEAEIGAGRFRSDLYFRLNGIAVTIPPLRERVDEIEGLASAFIVHACQKAQRDDVPLLSQQALSLLQAYSWPGNIRELRNVMERAVLLSTEGVILPEHLPVDKMGATVAAPAGPWGPSPYEAIHFVPRPPPSAPRAPFAATVPPPPAAPSSFPPPRPAPSYATPLPVSGPPASAPSMSSPRAPAFPPPPLVPPRPGPPSSAPPPAFHEEDARLLPRTLRGRDEGERERILWALEKCAGNQTKAARLLGISRRTLVGRLEEYNLPRPRKNAL
ncbi:MAG: sigma 54-interacting transcriptional regulator [Polyangiaceae bacterium]